MSAHACIDLPASGSITHPVSGRYSNDEQQCWRINCLGTVVIKWDLVDTEEFFDKVYVRGGEFSHTEEVAVHSGFHTSLPDTTVLGPVVVSFESDQSSVGSGFRLSYTCAQSRSTPPPTGCTPSSGEHGSIGYTSPGWRSGSDACWSIPCKQVYIGWYRFNTTAHLDAVTISGPTGGMEFGPISGNPQLPFTASLRNGPYTLRFTGLSAEASSFNATYSCYNPDSGRTTATPLPTWETPPFSYCRDLPVKSSTSVMWYSDLAASGCLRLACPHRTDVWWNRTALEGAMVGIETSNGTSGLMGMSGGVSVEGGNVAVRLIREQRPAPSQFNVYYACRGPSSTGDSSSSSTHLLNFPLWVGVLPAVAVCVVFTCLVLLCIRRCPVRRRLPPSLGAAPREVGGAGKPREMKALPPGELSQLQIGFGDVPFPEPPHMVCPISLQLMRDPVKCVCGVHAFERACLTEHLKRHPQCPLSRQPMTEEQIQPHDSLRAEIEAYVAEQRCLDFFPPQAVVVQSEVPLPGADPVGEEGGGGGDVAVSSSAEQHV